ncbi:phage head closure protein [Romboutsia sp.]|uniref:phage head closure protein n=1 Tax=Romboutsia sp. TaxID=1965302 RepID=UPI002C4E02F7|nr:phage head closure protein [Romboutsia sp.]HSQ88095.1 phage head closure protein [Romboutsia sp.]
MSNFDDVLELINITYGQNSIGDTIKTKTYTEIFGTRKSIKQSEFYQAQSTGLKPELSFEINSFEYNDEKYARYNNKEYNILRTYQKSIDKLEIVLEGVVNG